MGENITQNSGFTGNAEEKFSWDVTHMSKKWKSIHVRVFLWLQYSTKAVQVHGLPQNKA